MRSRKARALDYEAARLRFWRALQFDLIQPRAYSRRWRIQDSAMLELSLARSPQNVTEMLLEWGKGDREALDKLIPIVYEELRRQAARFLQS
jgi:hypothetical protein